MHRPAGGCSPDPRFARGTGRILTRARILLRPCSARLLASLVGKPDGFAAGAFHARPWQRGVKIPPDTQKRSRAPSALRPRRPAPTQDKVAFVGSQHLRSSALRWNRLVPGGFVLAERRVASRPGDVMSDLVALSTVTRSAQCRESRASRAQRAELTRSTDRTSRPKRPTLKELPPAAKLC